MSTNLFGSIKQFAHQARHQKNTSLFFKEKKTMYIESSCQLTKHKSVKTKF